MIVTFFDTETTNLVNTKKASGDPSQPHLLQMALLMMDTLRREPIMKISCLIGTNEPIGQKAFEAHGISNEFSMKFGFQPRTGAALFKHFVTRSDRLVAHNKGFDIKMMQVEAARWDAGNDPFVEKEVLCTMAAACPIVKSPPTPKMLAAGFKHYKNPNLGECIMHFFGEELLGAHDALVDTEACARVYFKLLDMGVIKE